MLTENEATSTDKRFMRVLRSRSSHRYFTGKGWTDDPERATSFSTALEAAEACTLFGLQNMELTQRGPERTGDLSWASI